MQVGMALAIKTLADDFQPLPRGLQVVHRRGGDRRRLGFDYISTSEHHFEDDAWSPSQLPILANIAGRTSRIRSAHERVLAAACTIRSRVSKRRPSTCLSNGRLDLICGTGSVEEEFVAFGHRPEDEVGSALGGDGDPPHVVHGRAVSRSRAGTSRSRSRSARRPSPCKSPFPLWVGGLGSKLQYNSGKPAASTLQGGPVFRPEYLEGLKEAGIDPMTRNLAMFVSAATSRTTKEQAWEECKVGWWNWQNEYRKRTWIAMLDSPMKAVPPLAPLDQLDQPPEGFMAPLLGTPDDILGALVPMLEGAQCTHFSFAFHASGGGMADEVVRPGIGLFAEEMLPVLKTLDGHDLRAKD